MQYICIGLHKNFVTRRVFLPDQAYKSIISLMYKLSPSDFAYLWQECRYCYYQKVKHNISHSGPFPAMFGRINGLLQTSIMGMNLQDVHPSLPSGIISVQEGFLRSKPIPGAEDCFVQGRFDILTRLTDGSYTVIDFKITTPDEEKIQKYATQLHAYKFALENPHNGTEPRKISRMGVVSINPDRMKLVDGKIVFTASPTWHPVAEDMESFYSLAKEISGVLNGPLPAPSVECKLCIYRSHFPGQADTSDSSDPTSDLPF